MPASGIEIDEELIRRVMRARRLPTRRLTIDYALRRLVAEPLSREEALALRGSGWDVRARADGDRARDR